MAWRPQEDVFVFSMAFRGGLQRLLDDSVVLTKRQLLTEPLGSIRYGCSKTKRQDERSRSVEMQN